MTYLRAFLALGFALGCGDDPRPSGDDGSSSSADASSADTSSADASSTTSSTTTVDPTMSSAPSTSAADDSSSGGADACALASGQCVCAGTCATPTDPALDAACPQPGEDAGACSMTCCIEADTTSGEPPGEPCGCYAQATEDACHDAGTCIWYPDPGRCTYAKCGDLDFASCQAAKICGWIDGYCYPFGTCE